MDEFRHMLEAAVTGIARGGSQWLNIEKKEIDDIKTEKYIYTAQKLGVKNHKIYTTIVELYEDVVRVEGIKSNYEFNKSDIVNIELKKEALIETIDIMRFIVAFGLCFVPTPPVLYGLFAGALFFYYTLIHTIKITLKGGVKINVYYMNNDDAQILVDKLTK